MHIKSFELVSTALSFIFNDLDEFLSLKFVLHFPQFTDTIQNYMVELNHNHYWNKI